MDVRVCQKKCSFKDDCKEYNSFHKVPVQNKDIPLPIDSQPMQIEVAWDIISRFQKKQLISPH